MTFWGGAFKVLILAVSIWDEDRVNIFRNLNLGLSLLDSTTRHREANRKTAAQPSFVIKLPTVSRAPNFTMTQLLCQIKLEFVL